LLLKLAAAAAAAACCLLLLLLAAADATSSRAIGGVGWATAGVVKDIHTRNKRSASHWRCSCAANVKMFKWLRMAIIFVPAIAR
jgi:hypothetical protein